MPAELAEESIELTIELLEAGTPTRTSYPFPSLHQTGRTETRTFRTVTLENAHLRAVLLPDLGGRLIRLLDKNSGRDTIPFDPQLRVLPGGLRGVSCDAGLQIRTTFTDRLNAMGHMASLPDFADGEDDPAAIWFAEVGGDGVGLHVRYALPPDSAWLEIEVRAFNRQFESVQYSAGIGLANGGWRQVEDGWFSDGGLLVHDPETAFSFGNESGLNRFDRLRWLSPRQLDCWKVRLIPFSQDSNIRGVSSHMSASWDRAKLVIQSSESALASKIVVLTESGQTLELPADLRPEHSFEADLSQIPSGLSELVVLNPAKSELLRAKSLPPAYAGQLGEPEPRPAQLDQKDLPGQTFTMAHRHLAHLQIGYGKLAARDFVGAAQAFEQSLLFNAEDHLTWWMKALAHRLAGDEEEERPELLNAHFLAPLEPALRAESYLASPSQVREKSAVLNALEEFPESFVEVACLLLEANLLEEAAKWIDEALRHSDLPMLRYLLAYAYLLGSRMDVQAGEQVQLAVRAEPEPPFPWRPIERQAIQHLAERFPADGSLRRLLGVAPNLSDVSD